jgi:hypothetical protein
MDRFLNWVFEKWDRVILLGVAVGLLVVKITKIILL